jgi:cell division protein FtsB
MKLRGRHWLILWAAVFLGTAVTVAVRQRVALRTARALDETRNRRGALEARRADLEQRIRTAESREVLTAKAMRNLGLRFAADSEIVFLTVPDGSQP